ncbi:hypothetical protein K523DRAFT_417435 [Schizophyllum commune Tattone D]|nr:hypothetical protein K523DRAFT_417435 [Schizophyllum commune Tattone D]
MEGLELYRYNTTQLCSNCGHSFTSVCGDHGLTRLARSAYLPTNKHFRELLHSGLATLEASLRDCDAELARFQAAMWQLQLHRASVENSVADARALLAPIRSVPPEVMREIAAYTLPPRWFDDPVGTHRWPFAQVCHAWREIAFGLRWPWADFRLPDSVWDRRGLRGGSLFAAVTEYIQRSGRYPLRVSVGPPHPITSWISIDPQVWQVIWTNTDRLQALDSVTSVVNRMPYPFLPALTSLSIRGHLPDESEDETVALPDTGLVPNLRTLQLSFAGSPASSGFDWSMLHVLDTRCARLDDLHVLSMCSNLVQLRICSAPGALASNPIHLPSLEWLCVGYAAIDLCPSIRAPRLTHFMLDALLERCGESWYLEESLLVGRYALLFQNLLAPVETLVFRNMFSYSADTLYGILLLPRRLRALYFVGGEYEFYERLDTPEPWNQPTDHVHYDLGQKLVLDKSHPELTDLQLVVFYNQHAPSAGGEVEWEEDWELLQEIWRSRTDLRSCAPPSHLRILVPMVWTDFKEDFEVPATLIGYDGKDEERHRDWDILRWIFAF